MSELKLRPPTNHLIFYRPVDGPLLVEFDAVALEWGVKTAFTRAKKLGFDDFASAGAGATVALEG